MLRYSNPAAFRGEPAAPATRSAILLMTRTRTSASISCCSSEAGFSSYQSTCLSWYARASIGPRIASVFSVARAAAGRHRFPNPGKFLDRRHEPCQELIVRLYRGTRAFGIVSH